MDPWKDSKSDTSSAEQRHSFQTALYHRCDNVDHSPKFWSWELNANQDVGFRTRWSTFAKGEWYKNLSYSRDSKNSYSHEALPLLDCPVSLFIYSSKGLRQSLWLTLQKNSNLENGRMQILLRMRCYFHSLKRCKHCIYQCQALELSESNFESTCDRCFNLLQ